MRRDSRGGRLKGRFAFGVFGVGIMVLAGTLVGGVGPAAAASPTMLSAVDCSYTYGDSPAAGTVYMVTPTATTTGDQVTVTLGSNCNGGPYYLGVYTTAANVWGNAGVYPVSGWNFPVPADFPETLVGSPVLFAQGPRGLLTATADLPTCSSWQLDVFAYSSATDVPSSFTYNQAINFGFPPGIWAELGPWSLVNGVLTAASPSACSVGPFTIGYWKHWNSYVLGSTNPGPSGNPIMDSFLPQLLGNYDVTSASEGVAVLSNPSAKYAENQLAAQLLAAELNVTAGANSCLQLASAITTASSLLVGVGYNGPPSSLVGPRDPQRAEFVSTADTLNLYNNGQLC